MFLHLNVVEDLNRECFSFNLHSICIFLIFSTNLNLYEQKCQTLLLLVPTLQNTPQALLRVLSVIILLLHPQVLCTPSPFSHSPSASSSLHSQGGRSLQMERWWKRRLRGTSAKGQRGCWGCSDCYIHGCFYQVQEKVKAFSVKLGV